MAFGVIFENVGFQHVNLCNKKLINKESLNTFVTFNQEQYYDDQVCKEFNIYLNNSCNLTR